MKEYFRKYIFLLLTFVISFVIFYPSLYVFFTNDDFFFLNISRTNSIPGFLNFFNIIKGPDGFGMYRPLTTQVFYFISRELFNLNPLPLHILSFIVFFGIVYLVYRIVLELLSGHLTIQQANNIALISAFLYAVSATHFGQLYYLAAFQELGMTFFVLLSCLSFIKGRNILSLIYFILALLSKETAVVTPLLITLIYFFQRFQKTKVLNLKKYLIFLIPFIICLLAYLFIRIRWYGFASGDSYIWDFSIKKLVNTLFWYLVWALNIPESLVDFVGPGLKVNSTLFVNWGVQIIPIMISFLVQGILLVVVLIEVLLKRSKKEMLERDWVSVFCIGWFLIGILPVAFLPQHKFSFYLTLPLIGLTFRIAYLLITSKVNKILIGLFLLVWTITSVLTLKFTYQTNWISQSELVAKRAHSYFDKNKQNLVGKNIYLVDTIQDLTLPWSPTSTVMTILSDKNFFEVFYPGFASEINYSGTAKTLDTKNTVIIKSDQILGY
jgi:hypothetical protein